jgi:hypothetical protein
MFRAPSSKVFCAALKKKPSIGVLFAVEELFESRG